MIKPKDNQALLDTIIAAIEDKKGEDIQILDLTEIENAVSSYFVICSANSNTQVAAIAGSIEDKTRKELKEKPFHTEGLTNALWVLMDYVSIVVHIFQRDKREFYDLESMWGDAKNVSITS
ncbi:MAG: ribosome silencing factor [Weeksellaceae bacterium]|nr:ribosome silencing factor [Weeksellaceae bacterium]